MRPRQEVLHIFSSFVRFEAERFKDWVTDSGLRRNMQRLKEASLESSESFWALYWHNLWKSQHRNSAVLHLMAYLQEPCYWASQQTITKFTNIQYTLPDCFNLAIADVDTILRGFNPNRGASLKTYAGMAFPSLLRDILLQRKEAHLCSDFTLLRKVSKKRFIEALQHAGLSSSEIAQHQLAWMCFKESYTQNFSLKRLPKPDENFWAAVANLYNTEQQRQLKLQGAQCNPTTLKQWIANSASWVRNYLYPPVQSLNMPKPGQEEGQVQDDLPDSLSDSLLAEMIAQDDAQNRQIQRSQLNEVLTKTLHGLDDEYRAILELYYGKHLTQQQITKQTGIPQPTVSRRLRHVGKSFFPALVEWSREVLNISPTPTLIEDMSAVLAEWLKVHYSEPDDLIWSEAKEEWE